MPGWQAVRRMGEDDAGLRCSSSLGEGLSDRSRSYSQGRVVASARTIKGSSLPTAVPPHECGVSLAFLVQFVEAVQDTDWLPVRAINIPDIRMYNAAAHELNPALLYAHG